MVVTGGRQAVLRDDHSVITAGHSDAWGGWLARLNRGDWRTPVFFEIVSAEINARSGATRPTVVDVGCGGGFDGEARFQQALSEQAGRFIGIEPDLTIEPPNIFSEVLRTPLEDAPITRGSVDVAYAIMVMEHVAHPAAFWARLYDILAPGGVFVAFSVNGAHWAAPVTRFLSAMRLKSAYLSLLRGKRGIARVADYPVYYRTNTLAQIERVAGGFRTVKALPFGAIGDVASYAPHRLRPIVRTVDRAAFRLSGQQLNIIIRAER